MRCKIHFIETKNTPQLEIRAQSAEEEFQYLTNFVLMRLPFYERYGYKVSLPELEVFKHPIEQTQKERLFQEFIQKEYNGNFYIKGIEILKQQIATIEKVFPIFKRLEEAWGFKLFPKYTVKLTKYGPGGSYNSDKAVVTMLTTLEGGFKRPDPAHTVVHEFTHMGIEECIVKKYKPTHMEKERLVDLLCKLLYIEFLPNYKLQSIGDSKIDQYVTKDNVFKLPMYIEQFANDNPR